MVKIFQGDYLTVEKDINSWMEVYSPKIIDIKQSVVLMQKEHDIVLLVTIIYEPKDASNKVGYKIYKEKQ